MAVGLLPGRISSCNSNCVLGSDVHNFAGCSCRVASLSMASSSARAFMSSISSEAGSCSSSSSYDLLHFYPVRRFTSSSAGAVCLQRKALVSAAFGQQSKRSWNDQRRACLRASATKDTSSKRDVLSQTSRNGNNVSSPPQRYPPPRNDKAEDELTSETEVQEEEEQIVSGDNGLSRKEGNSELPVSGLSSNNLSAPKERIVEEEKPEEGGFPGSAALGTVAAGLGVLALIGGFGALGFFYREQINAVLIQFSEFLEGTPQMSIR